MSVTESRPFTTNNSKYKYARNLAFGSFAVFLLGGALMLQPLSIADNSYADSTSTDISVNIGEVIVVPEVSTDSINIELDPTAADGDFKTASVTVGVSTNRTAGYTLTASVEGDETALTNVDYDNYEIAALGGKTAAATFADLDDSDSMNKWGYATDNNGDGDGQTEAGYYYAMPGVDNPTTLKITDGPANTSETEVTFATKGKDLAAGKYENTVVFTAVGNLETPCTGGCTIHYDSNGADGGFMGDQTMINDLPTKNSAAIDETNYTSVVLRAQNFWRSGYGFAGWNTKADGTGITYGPMESVDLGGLVDNNEVTLYAKWIASAGQFASSSGTVWSGCPSLTSGQMTALTDVRDNNTYTVAKLADGKCWMTENLRLGGASAMTLNSTTSVTAGTLKASVSSGFSSSGATTQQMSALNTMIDNFSNLEASPLYSDRGYGYYWYGFGNYYSWAQAIMSTTTFSTKYTNVSSSLCPKGWRLPKGQTAETNTDSSNDFYALLHSSGNMTAYPTNFVLSGEYSSSGRSYVGGEGRYISSTVYDQERFSATDVSRSGSASVSNGAYKYSGGAVRCLIGG